MTPSRSPKNEVARLDPNAADLDRAAECGDLGPDRRILREAAAAEDRPFLGQHLRGVAMIPVDDRAAGTQVRAAAVKNSPQ